MKKSGVTSPPLNPEPSVNVVRTNFIKKDQISCCSLNDETIPQIKAKVIAGTANNVLEEEDIHGNMIKNMGILYAPDFVINAGGLINVYHELKEYNIGRATRDIEKIYDRLLEIFQIADRENIHTQLAAKVFAKKRIETINNIQDNYIKR